MGKESNITTCLSCIWASQMVKNLPANSGHERDVGLISGLGRFLPVFLPGEFHG